MKKRFKYCFVTLFAVICLAMTNVVSAAGNVGLVASSTSIKPGDTVTITVNVSGEVSGIDTKVTYNNSLVKFKSISGTGSDKGTYVTVVKSSSGAINGSAAVITFEAIAEGTATFALNGGDFADTSNNPISVTKGTASVTIKTPAVVPPDNNSNNNNNNNTSNTTKSSNNYLKSLQIDEEGLTPKFNKNTLNYAVTVGEKAKYIKVTAKAEDANAKVTVTGGTSLKEGDNRITIVVTAQNGAKRTYTIVATKTSNPATADAYLQNLVIENITLNPEFSSQTLEYDLGKVNADVTKLNIMAYPNDEKATVSITGHEALVEGENTIKILVTAADGKTTKEYVLKVVKKENEVVDVANTNQNENNNKPEEEQQYLTDVKGLSFWQRLVLMVQENKLLLLLYAFIIVEFIEIIYLYIKLKKVQGTDNNFNPPGHRRGRKEENTSSNIDINIDDYPENQVSPIDKMIEERLEKKEEISETPQTLGESDVPVYSFKKRNGSFFDKDIKKEEISLDFQEEEKKLPEIEEKLDTIVTQEPEIVEKEKIEDNQELNANLERILGNYQSEEFNELENTETIESKLSGILDDNFLQSNQEKTEFTSKLDDEKISILDKYHILDDEDKI